MGKHLINGIDISSLLDAIKIFEQFRTDMVSDRDKAGAIQAFEFCFELSWKTMKRVLAQRGVQTNSPRDTFREAALNQLISDVNQWFIFLENRNLSSHTYKQKNLEQVLNIFDDFSVALNTFIKQLQNNE